MIVTNVSVLLRKLSCVAEMEAAKKALENSAELFPQLDYQKRVMAHSMKRQKGTDYDADGKRPRSSDQQSAGDKANANRSNLPKQYRPRGEDSDTNESESDDEKIAEHRDSDDENGDDCDVDKTDADSEQTVDEDRSQHAIVQMEQSNHSDGSATDSSANRVSGLDPSEPCTSARDCNENVAQQNDVHMPTYCDSDASIESGEIV